MIDCLLIGLNDTNFEDYVDMVRCMGVSSGAFKDLNTSFIEYKGKPYRALDILSHFYFQQGNGAIRPFHNADFLWPTILYLGTYLTRRGFSFDYVNLFQQEKQKLRSKLEHNEVLTVAITTTLYVSSHPILEIISFIRQITKKVKIIVGGPYIFNLTGVRDPESVRDQLKYMGADIYVISQEGEKALVDILGALKNGRSLDNICNIGYQKDGGYVVTPAVRENNPLEENMVDYSLFPKEDIGEFISLWTSKSCPFSCAFCGFPQRAGRYVFLDVDMVECVLNRIRDVGNITTATFLDDTLNVPKERFKSILRMMIRNRYGFRWNCFFRCDNSDEETITLMAAAGCEGVVLGVESGNNEMLKRMNKASKKEDYLKAIPLLKQAGIIVYAGIIIGFPGETEETAVESMDLIEEAKPDFFRAQLWYCDPLTPIWKKRGEYGIRGSAFHWSHDTMNSETAAALVQDCFLRAKDSLWLPQYGFELWSVFYLMRRGMTLTQVKNFINCFNATIKEKLLFPKKNEIGDILCRSLRESCQYDKHDKPDLNPVTRLSGSRYAAAEAFWANEGRQLDSVFDLEVMRDGGVDSLDREEEVVSLTFFDGLLDLEGCVANVSPCQIILSAYSVLLSRLSGQETVAVLFSTSDWEEGHVIPIWLSPSWDRSFEKYVLDTQEKMQQAREYARYASYFFSSSRWMKKQGIPATRFEVGCVHHKVCDDFKIQDRSEEMKEAAFLDNRKAKLLLEIYEQGKRFNMVFTYKVGSVGATSIKDAGSSFLSLLNVVLTNKQVLIGEIDFALSKMDYKRGGFGDSKESFNF